MTPTEHDVTGPDGVRLHVAEVGSADRPAVLLLHGVGSSGAFLLEAFAAPLLAAGWRLLAADLRGHGRSTALPTVADHAFDRHVTDLAVLVDRFAPTVIGGVSLGGQAAVGAAAAQVPCDAVLACLPAWSGRAVPGEGPHAAVAAEVASVGVAGMLARFRARHHHGPLAAGGPAAGLGRARPRLADGGPDRPRRRPGADRHGARRPPGPPGRSWAGPTTPATPSRSPRTGLRTAPRATLRTTTLDAVQADRTAMGRAAVAALTDLGITPP